MPFVPGHFKPVIWTGLLALGLTTLAGGVWAALVVANLRSSPGIPWAVAVMGILLWTTWQYLGGKGWPQGTSEARRSYRRANSVSGHVFAWALLAGTLSIAGLAGLWIVFIGLANKQDRILPDFSQYPWLTVALVVLMASMVSSVAEEVGFRGYFQTALERAVGVQAGILIQCLVIAIAHALTQGFKWNVVIFYFLVDLMLGVTAYLANSILPGIVIHSIGLLIFFTLIWPADRLRLSVTNAGGNTWFWIHTIQGIVFSLLAIMAFKQLSRIRQE